MSANPLPIRLAQVVGITASSALAGTVFSMSFYSVPRLLESPSPLLLKQWSNLFNAGRKTAPPIGALSAVSYFYLAYASTLPSQHKSKLYGYLAAGILSMGIMPYTLAVMLPTNKKLLAKVEEMKAFAKGDSVVEVGLGEETAHKLVDWWAVLNLGRGLMLGIAGILGAWTALK